MERSHAAEGTQTESDIVILYTQFSMSYMIELKKDEYKKVLHLLKDLKGIYLYANAQEML